jgi:hypothetical protein
MDIKIALRKWIGKYYDMRDYNIYKKMKEYGCYSIFVVKYEVSKSTFMFGSKDVIDFDNDTVNEEYFNDLLRREKLKKQHGVRKINDIIFGDFRKGIFYNDGESETKSKCVIKFFEEDKFYMKL